MTESMQPESGKFYGWFNVLFLFLIYAAIMGFVFYGFTAIFPAMIRAEGWGRGEAALAHTFRGLFAGFMAPLVAYAIGRLGPKKTMRIGLASGAIALLLLGTVADRLWHWILIWGFIMPFTFSFSGVIPIQTIVTFWFNLRRATAIGIVVTGSAVAGFIAAPLFTYLIKTTGTWRTGWLSAAGFAALALGLSFFLKNKPQDIGQHPDGIPPEQIAVDVKKGLTGGKKTYRTAEPWTLKEALRLPAIYLFFVCMLAQLATLYILTVHGVLHLMDKNYTSMQAASVIGNLILFSGFARFPVGVLADRIEARILLMLSLLGMGISLIFFWKVPTDLMLLLTVAGAYGLCFGATVTLFPTMIGNYFGPTAFAPINGFITPFIVALSAPVPFLAGMIFDHYKSYDWAFIPIIILVFVATAFSFFLTPPSKKAAMTASCSGA
jgi:sugar phosphate permease